MIRTGAGPRLRPCPNCGKLVLVKEGDGTVTHVLDECPGCGEDPGAG